MFDFGDPDVDVTRGGGEGVCKQLGFGATRTGKMCFVSEMMFFRSLVFTRPAAASHRGGSGGVTTRSR